MMLDRARLPLQAGQEVLLALGPSPDSQSLRTTVVHIDARAVWVDAAPASGWPIDVAAGHEVTCHASRAMDALYSLRARVVALAEGVLPEARHGGAQERPLLGLDVFECLRVQQRSFVRVDVSMLVPARIRVEEGEPRRFKLQVRDLSGGGLRGATDVPIAHGDELDVALRLPTGADAPGAAGTSAEAPAPTVVHGRVVRVIEKPRAALPREIGVTFVDLPAAAHERIVRFVLNVQLERRRHGVI